MTALEDIQEAIQNARERGDLGDEPTREEAERATPEEARVNRAALYGYAKALYLRQEIELDALYAVEKELGYSTEEVEALPV